jgi:hypothetical protein
VAAVSVRRFIIDEQHVPLAACDVRDHPVAPGSLLHVPDYGILRLAAVELRTAEGPEFREIELESASFVPEGGKKLAVKGHRADFWAASAYVKYAVFKRFTCLFGLQVAG